MNWTKKKVDEYMDKAMKLTDALDMESRALAMETICNPNKVYENTMKIDYIAQELIVLRNITKMVIASGAKYQFENPDE